MSRTFRVGGGLEKKGAGIMCDVCEERSVESNVVVIITTGLVTSNYGGRSCSICGTRKGEDSDVDTQTSEQSVIEGVKKQLYIDGEWRDDARGRTVPVEEP